MAKFIKFASYNLHGIQQGKSQLLELCQSHDVIAIQEHWLPDYNLNKIVDFHSDFLVVAKSAMSEKIRSGFLRGRPFGGVAVLVRKAIIRNIRVVGVDTNNRCLAVMITFHGDHKMLLIDVYLPCSEPSNEYRSALLDSLGFIENCIVCNDYDAMMIVGDFNFDCVDSYPGYSVFKSLCDEYKVMCCDSRAKSGIKYTYFHESLNRYSVIDHMFIDEDAFANVIEYDTIDSGLNLSDHVPISCTLALPLCADLRVGSHSRVNQQNRVKVLRWDRGDLSMYYSITGQMLQGMYVPYDLLTTKCDGHICSHLTDINCFYKEIVDILDYAAKCSVQLVQCDTFKPYWNAELQQLKEDSVQAHLAWTAMGKPRQGWINQFRLRCKYRYKAAIKNAALAFEWDLDDELGQFYIQKDMNKFWKNGRVDSLKEIPFQVRLVVILTHMRLQIYLKNHFLSAALTHIRIAN